jgi:hypothetical protein
MSTSDAINAKSPKDQLTDDDGMRWVNISRSMRAAPNAKKPRVRYLSPSSVFPKHVFKGVELGVFAMFRKEQSEPGCVFGQMPAVFLRQLE